MYADEVEKEEKVRRFGGKRERSTGIEGKWKHDKYQTISRAPQKTQFKKKIVISTGGGGRRNITTSSFRNRVASSSNVVASVPAGPSTLFINNLATSVSQEDLDELFEQYQPQSVTLHFDSNGQSLGTADLVVEPSKVQLIKKDLQGVLLDGNEIEVLEANAPKEVSVFDRLKKVTRESARPVTERVRVVMKPRMGKFGRGGRRF